MIIKLSRAPITKLAVIARLAPGCSLGIRTSGLFGLGTTKAGQSQSSILRSGQLKYHFKWYAFGIGASCTLFGVVVISPNKSFSTISNANNKSEAQENLLKETTTTSEREEKNSWHGLSFLATSLPVSRISSTISGWTWPSLPDFPDISGLRDKISSLLLELGRDSGSLYDKIVNQPPDFTIHPECEWDAEVRLGDDLCILERAFLRERKRRMRKFFAEFIGVSEVEIHEEDIPMVAIAGSGGGYRAMLNTTGSLTGAKAAGLFDCVAYAAGISGSCWALGIIYSGVSGSNDPFAAGQHIKDRVKLSYIDMSTLEALITAPTNEYLLSGILRKATGPGGTVSLVDLYGTMLASRLFVPADLNRLDPRHLSLSQFSRNIENGAMPLPIFTVLHHAISPVQAEGLKENKRQQYISVDDSRRERIQAQQRRLEEETPGRWLWYEFTPYEVGCDELGAWIPSWALGRQFMNGKSLDRRPELSFSILTGIFGSAFCASLKHYFSEVKPMLRALPFQLYDWLEEVVTENYEKNMGVIHPVLPNEVSNFVKGLAGQLRSGSPEGITEQDTLGFMDAGAELNIPYYPLLRRNVDCIIALDASADSQDLWFKRAEELAVKRGLRTWPRGTGWPVQIAKAAEKNQNSRQRVPPPDTDAQAANIELAEKQEFELALQTEKQIDSERRELAHPSKTQPSPSHLSSCEVWIGSSEADDSGSSRVDDIEADALSERDGIAIVYMPLVPNERRVPGYDPTALSTWTREVDSEESQRLLDVAEANFIEGVPKIRRLLHAIWLRKKREREAKETQRYIFYIEHLV